MHSKFKEMGTNVQIYQPVAIIKPEAIVFKNDIIISEFAYLAGRQGMYIGNHIHIATHTAISGGGIFIAEDFVGIAAGSIIITGTEDLSGNGIPSPTVPKKYRSFQRSFVYIKKHAFIASNVTVHPGVIIGEGVIVGSGSIVTKNLDDWGLYVGSPARRIKDRPIGKILELERDILIEENRCLSNFSEVIKKYIKVQD